MKRMFPGGPAIIVASFLLMTSVLGAQPLGHTTSAERLKVAFTSLKAAPTSRSAQHRYLKAFPHSYKGFQAYFGRGGALADGYECDYIFALSTLQSHHVAEVGSLLVQLSKDAEYQANAPSCLQNVMANYGSHFTRSFAGLLHQLPSQERAQLIAFLADVGSGTAHDYQGIIQNLKTLNEPELVKEFQQAQLERSRQSHK
ncbi:MAG: hypothetical protein JWM08_2326 [Candidatus Angelobacter sp.]|nr:hypothetical protein [Candidatus Angelobacter sp.]